MSSVVFLCAVNVGKANRCRPALIAKTLSKIEVINIGAVGTFVVRRKVSDSVLRAAIAEQLPFKSEIMICEADDVLKLATQKPFARQPSGPSITHFVNILARPLPKPPRLPLYLPTQQNWGVKIVSTQGRFLLGLYVRQMKAISYLGKLEKQLGVPSTTRSWTTMEKIVQALTSDF